MADGNAIKRAFYDGPEGQVHYRTGGTGEPLLLLHQTPRSSDSTYGDVLPILAKERRVIAMDNPGYGDSFKPTRQYYMEDYAKTAIMLLDSLNVGKASIVGSATGTLVGIEIAAAYPERVDKLILSYPVALVDDEERAKGLAALKGGDPWKMREDGSHLMDMWQLFHKDFVPNGPLELVNRLVMDRMKVADNPWFAMQAVFAFPMEKRLPLIQCPTLIIWGMADLEREDKHFGFATTEKRKVVSQLIPQSMTFEMTGPNSTALLSNLMRDEFAQHILDFLKV